MTHSRGRYNEFTHRLNAFHFPPPAAAQAIQSISETRPNPNTVQPVSQDMEPQPPEFASLSYTCVLVPRLPHHRLLGPLAECLSDWLPQICLAYGWRLAWQAIQPDCFEWAVVVTPVISPGIVVRLIRQLTSQRIFERYAGLAQENPSGDFWAPGYLIISGAQPPDAGLIGNYLQQTRRRQGL